MNNQKLIEATMEAMGFTEQLRVCQHCIYFKARDEASDTCTYSNLCEFPVAFNNSCNLFTPRPRTNDTATGN